MSSKKPYSDMLIFTYIHSEGCPDDQAVKDHVHRRKYQKYREHTYDRASCHQHTERSDHIDAGNESHTEGRSKEAKGTYNY